MADAPETLRDLRKDLKRAIDLMASKAKAYELGRDYYDGTRAEVAASTFARRIIEQQAEAMPVSLAHIPVDALLDKVQLSSLTSEDAAAADLLLAAADANDLEDEVDDWMTKAGYFGDYYVIVDPTLEDGEGRVSVDGIKWVGSSPLSTVMVYDKRDDRTAEYGVKVWLDGKLWRALVYYDDCTVAVVTTKGESLDADNFDFDFEEEEAEAFIFHDGERKLLIHLAIDGKPYGVPLHRKAWGPQDAITKISANNMSNVEALGLPARWAIADPAAQTDDDIDADFGDEGPGDTGGMSTATTGKSKVRVVPGGISYLTGIKQVGTFEGTSADGFLKNLDWYVRVMAVATGIALFEFDLSGEQPSGESRRRAESRAIKKADKIKRNVGSFLRELGDATLGVLGIEADVAASFKPSETATDKDGLELVSAKIKAGVPVRQALREAGYTDQQVDDWYPEDSPAITPDLLTILATALQQLGQAKTLTVINDADIQLMLPDVLRGARGEGLPAND